MQARRISFLTMKDLEYIEAFRKGDQKVIAEFYEKFRKNFYSHFKSIYHKDGQDIYDLYQDTCVALMDNIQKGSLKTLTCSLCNYMYKIGKNIMMASDRKYHVFDQKKMFAVDGETGDIILDREVIAQMHQMERDDQNEAIKNEHLAFVMRIVADMGSPCLPIIKEYYWSKRSCEEIAKVLGYKGADSVKTQKHKCMEKLKHLVKKSANI